MTDRPLREKETLDTTLSMLGVPTANIHANVPLSELEAHKGEPVLVQSAEIIHVRGERIERDVHEPYAGLLSGKPVLFQEGKYWLPAEKTLVYRINEWDPLSRESGGYEPRFEGTEALRINTIAFPVHEDYIVLVGEAALEKFFATREQTLWEQLERGNTIDALPYASPNDWKTRDYFAVCKAFSLVPSVAMYEAHTVVLAQSINRALREFQEGRGSRGANQLVETLEQAIAEGNDILSAHADLTLRQDEKVISVSEFLRGVTTLYDQVKSFAQTR